MQGARQPLSSRAISLGSFTVRWQGTSCFSSFVSKVLGANYNRANNFYPVADKFAMCTGQEVTFEPTRPVMRMPVWIIESVVQWDPFITDTFGEQSFGRYTEVAFVEGLFCVQNLHLGPVYLAVISQLAFLQGWPLRGVPL